MPVSSSNGLHGVHRASYPQTSPYACQLDELRQGRSGGACALPPACSTLHHWRGDTQLSILPLYNRPMRSLPYGPGFLMVQLVASDDSARSGGHALGNFGAGGRRCGRHPALSLACAASWPTHDLSSTRRNHRPRRQLRETPRRPNDSPEERRNLAMSECQLREAELSVVPGGGLGRRAGV